MDNNLIELLSTLTHNTTDDGYMTVVEIMAVKGWCNKRVREGLQALKADGQLEIGRVLRENLAGNMSTIPGYRIRREGV